MNKRKSLRQIAKTLGVSPSYLSQVMNGKRPASEKVCLTLTHEMLSNFNGDLLNTNHVQLGNRLAVGQRTLDPPGKVRILLPQPLCKHAGLLFHKKQLIPALQQFLMNSDPFLTIF